MLREANDPRVLSADHLRSLASLLQASIWLEWECSLEQVERLWLA
jgi:hypothetical protein